MNKIFSLILFILTAAAMLPAQSNYWETLTPPPGGVLGRFAASGLGHVYLSQNSVSSFFKSSDFGLHWESLTMPFAVPNSYSLSPTVSKNGRLWMEEYISLANPVIRNIYSSTDAGETWQVAFDSSRYFSIVELPSGKLYALKDTVDATTGTRRSVFESADGGVTWLPIFDWVNTNLFNLTEGQFGDLIINSTPTISASRWLLHFDSTANAWHPTNYQNGLQNCVFTPSRKMLTLSIGLDAMYIYHPDSTYSYAKVDTLVDNWPRPFQKVVNILQDDSGTVYLATNAGLIRSEDEGATWAYFKDVRDLTYPLQRPLPNGEWLAYHGNLLVRTADGFLTQNMSSYGLNEGLSFQLRAVDSTHLFAKTEAALWCSTDDGQSWELNKLDDFVLNISTDGENHYFDGDGNIFLVTQDSLLRSQDFGTTWVSQPLPDGPGLDQTAASFIPGPQILFVNGRFGTARSTDFGGTWAYVTDSLFVKRIEAHPSGALFGVFETNSDWIGDKGKLLKSVDGGLTWALVRDSIGTITIDADGNIFTYYEQTFKSIDLGETWHQVPGGKYYVQQREGVLYGNWYPPAISQDGGLTWNETPVNPSGPNHYIASLEMDDRLRLYLGSVPIYRSKKSVLVGTTLTGQINRDADADCSTPDPSDPLRNWLVKANNGSDTWFANTDTAGKYRMFVDTGSYEISIRPPLVHLLWEACEDTLNIDLPKLLDTTEADFLIKALADCPYLGVDLAISPIQPCFLSYGSVAWCNYGTETADTAYLDLKLDPLLELTSSSLPGDSLGGGIWRFQLGSIESGECGNLWFEFITDCDSTVVGQALCLGAHIFPDSLCVDVPGWSGALLKVTATCVNDTSVHFEIQNIGNAQSQPLEYIIVEDDVVLLQGQPNIYDVLEIKNEYVSMPDGHFYRLETEQEPGYPLGNVASAFSINCGAPTLSPTVIWYNLDDGPLSFDNECSIAVASFDPNDKTGLPLGYGNAHLIEANTDLEYTIRFQNTGTAAAHFVVVRDTLSEKLDPMSIRPGAASHPFSWKMEGTGVVSFRFDDINLPDSNANEAASHGFVSFKISQKPGLPDGTLIQNRASIYFDYNGAVQTNTTTHRIGHDFIKIVETSGPEGISPKIKTWPNPLSESALLTFDGLLKTGFYTFSLTDISGKKLCELPFSGDQVFFRRENLPSGLYFFEIKNGASAGVFSGKLVLE